jgi:hypothetical protein
MNTIDETGDINIDDVSVIEHVAIRDAMTDHFIQRGTDTLGVTVIIERARIRPALDGQIVDQNVDVVSGDTGLYEVTGLTKNVSGHIAGVTHSFDDFGGLHVGFVPPLHFASIGVGGFDDISRNGSHG